MLTWSKTNLGPTYRRLRNHSDLPRMRWTFRTNGKSGAALGEAEDTAARLVPDSCGQR
jgi:hypothetical protein